MSKVIDVKTHLTDAQIEKRVFEVARYDRFSVFTFEFKSAEHEEQVLTADGVMVTSKDGSIYTGTVEDWDEAKYFVNLT